MLFLSLYVVAVVAMFVITVRTRPNGRPVVARARLRRRRTRTLPGGRPAVVRTRRRHRRTAASAPASAPGPGSGPAPAPGPESGPAPESAPALEPAPALESAPAPEPAPAPAPEPVGAESGERPVSLEGMLAILVLTGEITGRQYRLAVEELAAQDDVRHPLTVPPDPGPPTAGGR